MARNISVSLKLRRSVGYFPYLQRFWVGLGFTHGHCKPRTPCFSNVESPFMLSSERTSGISRICITEGNSRLQLHQRTSRPIYAFNYKSLHDGRHDEKGQGGSTDASWIYFGTIHRRRPPFHVCVGRKTEHSCQSLQWLRVGSSPFFRQRITMGLACISTGLLSSSVPLFPSGRPAWRVLSVRMQGKGVVLSAPGQFPIHSCTRLPLLRTK